MNNLFNLMGADHDLTGAVRRLGGGTTEYIRVTIKRYKEFGQ
jgi:hypothetical protein